MSKLDENGQFERRFPQPKLPRLNFSEKEKRTIVEDYLTSGKTMTSIWKKYTGRVEGQFQISRWMKKYGYIDKRSAKSAILGVNPNSMTPKDSFKEDDSFETLLLKKRIAVLEKQVKDSELKAEAFSTMVDLTEEEFNISIRKKYDTKPSKK